MKLNQEKCHLLVCGHKHESIRSRIGQTKIRESRKQKLLGAEINSNLICLITMWETGNKVVCISPIV